MTDSTPPSIPPRSRPTSPTPTGRQTTSSPVHTGTNAAWNGSDEADAKSPVSVPSMNGGPSGTTSATVLPPTVAPPSRTSTSGGRTATSGSGNGSAGTTGTTRTAASSAAPTTAKASIRLGDGVTVPPEKDVNPATSPADGPEDDGPSPMMVAVDATTAWFKKAGAATTAAFASMTKPRPEEPTMTTTPAAPAAKPAPRPAAAPTENARPSTGRIPTVAPHGGPRRVRLAISRVDPWSVMKLSLLLSVAIGVMMVVAVTVIWTTLNGLHVFAKIDDLVTSVTGQEGGPDIKQYIEFRRVVSGAMLVSVVDVFLLTALATIGAFLYNIVAALVGGVHVTMTDE